MCGDMAGDPILAWVLMGLGLRNLSMAPRQIPVVKSIIRATQIADAERLLAQALTMSTETEIEELVYGAMNRRFPLELTDGEEDQPSRVSRRGQVAVRPARPEDWLGVAGVAARARRAARRAGPRVLSASHAHRA